MFVSDDGERSARSVQGRAGTLKREHAVVGDALRTAVLTAHAPVGCTAIIEALTPVQRVMLVEAYPTRTIERSVAKILGQLLARGCIASPGRGWRRYYIPSDMLQAAGPTPRLPEAPSARQRALQLLASASAAHGRAVRRSEIAEQIAFHPELEALSDYELTRALASVVLTGDAVIVEQVRGGGVQGRNFYLPGQPKRLTEQTSSDVSLSAHEASAPPSASQVDPPKPIPLTDGQATESSSAEPRTFLEAVVAAWEECWADAVREAAASGGDARPRPIATAAVRARVAAHGGAFADRANAYPMHVINAMQQLARTARPVVRLALKRAGHRAALWCPVDVADEGLDTEAAFATDTARVAAAVRRCARELGVPAVSRRQIVALAAANAPLLPVGQQPIAATLSAFASTHVHDSKRGSHWRGARPVAYLGKIGAQTFYAAPDGVPGSGDFHRSLAISASYVALRRAEATVAKLCSEERVAAISLVTAPGVRLGRADLMTQEAEAAAAALDALIAAVDVRSEDRWAARELRDGLTSVLVLQRDFTPPSAFVPSGSLFRV